MRALLFAIASILFAVAPAQADPYPSRPIRIVTPTPAGSVSDALARVISEELQKDTGTVVIIDNRAGGMGVIGSEVVAHAAPDGYTLLVSAISTHAQAPYLVKNLPYDPIRDFEPVCRLALFQWLLVSDPALGFTDAQSLIDAAKAKPGSLNFAYGSGSALASVVSFNRMFGIDAVGVGYKGQPQALMDIAAGRVSYMLVDSSVSASLINAGKLKALAVASDSRSALVPNVPTFKEAGIRGVEFVGWVGLSAPAKTPLEVRQWVSEKVAVILAKPQIVAKLQSLGILPAHQPPDEFGRYVQSEMAIWGKRITEAGIQPE
jgi:tripartite-type tricarboxylate transporter receptor subunit TctC